MNDYLTNRRTRAAAAWKLRDELVLIAAGEPVGIPGGADQTYRFVPHSEYRFLADRATPGAVVAFDPQDGWVDFLPPVTEDERVWEGREEILWSDPFPNTPPGPPLSGGERKNPHPGPLPEREREIRPLSELAGWLAARRGQTAANLGCPLSGLCGDTGLSLSLRTMLLEVRRPKDSIELDRMRRAVAATAAGFARAQAMIAPGISERRIQIEMEAEFFRHGADTTAYGSIVGTGSNAAVLHFSPTMREVRDGELILIDAGAEVEGYAADVTRTYGAGGLRGFAADLYAVVLKAQVAAIGRCKPGVEFREIHLAAARDMAVGLVELKILRGQPDALVERGAHALFFPHGLGHLVGLGVRDASGYLPGRKRSEQFGLNMLRLDLPLGAGYVVTIEPGLYFIPALLQDTERRREFADCVNWTQVDELLHIGGIRIEDDVLVTRGTPEVLTAGIPK